MRWLCLLVLEADRGRAGVVVGDGVCGGPSYTKEESIHLYILFSPKIPSLVIYFPFDF